MVVVRVSCFNGDLRMGATPDQSGVYHVVPMDDCFFPLPAFVRVCVRAICGEKSHRLAWPPVLAGKERCGERGSLPPREPAITLPRELQVDNARFSAQMGIRRLLRNAMVPRSHGTMWSYPRDIIMAAR